MSNSNYLSITRNVLIAAALLVFVDLIFRSIMLSKTGEKGIAVFIPFIGRIVEFKQYWNALWSIPYIIGIFFSYIFLFVAVYIFVAEKNWNVIPYVFGVLLTIPALTYLAMRYHTVKAFRKHWTMFLLELFSLGIVLDGILAFSTCKYERNRPRS